MLSVIIPARNEPFLQKTIDSLLENTDGKIEIIHKDETGGMRASINSGAAEARGEYIMKLDAHCMVDEGFDKKLIEAHQENWVQTPRRKRLDAEKWEIIKDGRPDVDYMFINRRDFKGYKDNGKNRDEELKKKLIDDVEIFQGSCWFMTRDYFYKLGLLDDKNFDSMGFEALEIVLKCRAKGGRVVVNKNTWYAHWHKIKGNFKRQREKSTAYLPEFIKQYGQFI